ncbi:uncharacterized protein DUF4878 [Pleionea mediterranea]|uniref:Uncharacterized protein DUF4878 n=2 Tax=Pleionea mediterranea TaxID=523701 RepID=A0A316FYX9_9GAMM|nr:uncharacterized protein DUF4878 [Pleionea mediterranea]
MTNKILKYCKHGLFYIGLLLLSACGMDQSDPEAVALEYVESVYFANLPRFKMVVEESDYDDNEDYRLFISKDSTAKSNTRKKRGDIALISVTDRYVNKGRARIRIKVEFNNGERRILAIGLHKKDDLWYINPSTWSRW